MDKSRATAMIESARSIGEHLNRLHQFSEHLPTEAERKEFRTHLGAVIGMVYTDIMKCIIDEYPDLDPDK